MKIKSIEEIKSFLTPYADSVGAELFDVEFKQGKSPTLTVFIDREGGADLDLCEKFHNAIFDPIDEFDPTFGQQYTLNVSSKGADWPFKREEDFLSHIGRKVEVKLDKSVKGKKYWDGELVSYNGKEAVIKTDDKITLTFDMKNVVKMNEFIDFE